MHFYFKDYLLGKLSYHSRLHDILLTGRTGVGRLDRFDWSLVRPFHQPPRSHVSLAEKSVRHGVGRSPISVALNCPPKDSGKEMGPNCLEKANLGVGSAPFVFFCRLGKVSQPG